MLHAGLWEIVLSYVPRQRLIDSISGILASGTIFLPDAEFTQGLRELLTRPDCCPYCFHDTGNIIKCTCHAHMRECQHCSHHVACSVGDKQELVNQQWYKRCVRCHTNASVTPVYPTPVRACAHVKTRWVVMCCGGCRRLGMVCGVNDESV